MHLLSRLTVALEVIQQLTSNAEINAFIHGLLWFSFLYFLLVCVVRTVHNVNPATSVSQDRGTGSNCK